MLAKMIGGIGAAAVALAKVITIVLLLIGGLKWISANPTDAQNLLNQTINATAQAIGAFLDWVVSVLPASSGAA